MERLLYAPLRLLRASKTPMLPSPANAAARPIGRTRLAPVEARVAVARAGGVVVVVGATGATDTAVEATEVPTELVAVTVTE